jgi:predicted RNA-binding protein with TRAM domain
VRLEREVVMRRHWSATAVIAASLALGGGPAAAQSSAPATVPAGGTVTVTVQQRGSDGSGLAAILFKDGDWQAGLGSFVADVTGDPFTMTETIRDAAPFLDQGSVDERPVAVIPPGTHNLVIWVARSLHSYAAWTPQAPIDAVCLVELTVREGSEVAVEVSVPPADGSGYVSSLPSCVASG